MIKLVPSRPEYAAVFFKWRNEEMGLRYNPLKNWSEAELREKLLQESSDLRRFKDFETFRWFIEWDEKIAGQINLSSIEREMRTAVIGYTVGQEFHGRGIATAALPLFITEVFEKTDLRKLIGYVHEENTASCRLLDRLGFKREGLLREQFLIHGKPVNEIFFGLLRSEWK